jgi:hypothetical protein
MHQTVPIASATEADALGLERTPPDYAFALPDKRELFEKWNTSKDEVARDKVFRGMFKRRIAAEPVGVGITWLRRSPRIWVGTTRFDIFTFRPPALAPGRPLYYLLKVGLFGLNVVGVPLGMGGILLAAWKRRWEMAWFALPVVYTIGVLFPLDVVEPRYSQHAYACLLVITAFMLRHLRVAWRRRRLRP